MPAILLSTFPKFITSSCGKEPARLELPARLVPGLPRGGNHICWPQRVARDRKVLAREARLFDCLGLTRKRPGTPVASLLRV